ncbi:MAG TPA: hypothetical protein VFQ88_09480 [Nevskiaceae bacterium]|nr:hypothetical protein [Nevskiaceae bacterium]
MNTVKFASLSAVVLSAAVLAGCASRNSATASNFAAAIDAHYAALKQCVVTPTNSTLYLTRGGFPVGVTDADMRTNPLFHALVNAHVLRISKHAPIPDILGPLPGTFLTPTVAYSGKIVIGTDGDLRRSLTGPARGLCAAHRQVVKVTNYKKLSAEEAAFSGGSSQTYGVEYTYRNKPVGWARIPAVAKALAKTGGPTGAHVHTNGSDGVDLTHNGWRVMRSGF